MQVRSQVTAVSMKYLYILLYSFLIFTLSACGGGSGGGSKPTSQNVVTGQSALSGKITASEGNYVDSDTNNPAAFYASNNTENDAQIIPNVATIGGFMTFAATGNPGDVFEFSTDRSDVFRVILSANQNITLTISDFGNFQDFDLYLYKTSDISSPVASSAGTGQTETINVPSDDEYFIVLDAFLGTSNYILTVGQLDPAMASRQVLRLEDEFMPGEVITKANTKNLEFRGLSTISNQTVAIRHGLQALRGNINRAALFRLEQSNNSATASKSQANCCGALSGGYGFYISASQREAYATIKAIKKLRQDKTIEYAEPNYIQKSTAVPDDTYYDLQWHYPLINLPQAWDYTTGDSNVIVAVVDTGVFLSHPDLAANLIPGYDFISSTSISNDGNGIDNNPDDPGDNLNPGYSSFHGTHVAGTIAAVSNNNSGVAGVAHTIKVMPIRVLGLGGGTSYDVTQGILYAAGLANDSGTTPTQSADIINLSLGGAGFSGAQQDAINAARNAGTTVIAAAGNESSNQPFYPAGYQGVISVSAVDFNKSLAPYSNYGNSIDVTAPGGDTSVDLNGDSYVDGVLSTIADDSSGVREPVYRFYQGTSMASPHVAGVVALMKSIHSALTPDVVDSLIVAGQITEDISGDGELNRNDNYGYGLIDALKAVQQATALATGNPPPTVLTVSPSIASIQSAQSSIELTVGKNGNGAISVLSFNTDTVWATLTPANIDLDGLGTYELNVNTTGLSDGVYTVLANFVSDTSFTISATINVIVNSVNVSPDAGRIHVLLIDSITGEKVYFTERDPTNGEYSYSITGVAPGDYYLLAGSDLNYNLSFCEAGESCGSYPTLGDAAVISVDSDITNLDFDISFDQNLDSSQFFSLGVEVDPALNAVQ
jgi:serine protease